MEFIKVDTHKKFILFWVFVNEILRNVGGRSWNKYRMECFSNISFWWSLSFQVKFFIFAEFISRERIVKVVTNFKRITYLVNFIQKKQPITLKLKTFSKRLTVYYSYEEKKIYGTFRE